ncbi:MAG: hypothetical protein E4G99_09840 [Anaerolineales bacterium]|nr:MAG: hypothetical protein E4G99_09840 [Anaerolineales bacterium]
MATLDPLYPLAPSETIYLNGDQFVKTAFLGYRVLGSETKVNLQELGRAVLAGSMLAMEAAGELKIELEEYKRLIGKGRRIKLTPLGEQTSFPIPSLEAVLQEICTYLSHSEKGATAKDVVWAAVGKDDDHPWNMILDSVPPHLADRGLLERIEEKKLKIFTVTNYELREDTRKLAREAPVAPIQELLSTCEASRPDLWKQLEREVNQAISARDSSDENDID